MKKLTLFTVSFILTTLSLNGQENLLPETGNVGIGTTNPNSKLDVKGKVNIDSTLVVGDSVVMEDDAHIKKMLIVDDKVKFTNLGVTEIMNNKDFMIIMPGGIIEKMNKGLVANEIGQKIYEEKQCTEAQLAIPTWSNGLKKIYSNCPEVLVGIGTNEPKFNLDVRGTTYTSKLAIGTMTTDIVPTQFYLRTGLNQNASSEVFLIENDGRKIFQINNNGTVKARDVYVNTQNWPDYVFEDTYVLPTLSEVEEYLIKYNHLPEVPDAKTVEAEGINLGEMERILMQKVEELTLYIINQDKLLKAQQEIMQQQAEQLKRLELLLQK